MVQNKIVDGYFDWMYHLVCNENYYNKLSYRKLLYLLNEIEFYPIVNGDDNRKVDGLYFRYHYGSECGYSYNFIDNEFMGRPCSVLEMMVALAYRVENEIMENSESGNRTGQWFWEMIVSLGLGSYNNDRFNENEIRTIIDNFLKRNYMPNGKGGLFTLECPNEDLRNVEIWTQFMWYLNEMVNQGGIDI